MTDSDRIAALGQALAEEQDRIVEADGGSRRAAVRAELLERAAVTPRRWRWVALPVLASVAAVVLLVWWSLTPALTFEVGQDRAAGVVGAWVAAPEERGELLTFSDGSAIDLAPGSKARVAHLESRSARVVLEAGAADVRIEPGTERQWLIDAGPYRVRVTGTEFMLAWNPTTGEFDLDLRSGSVVVEGPRLDGPQTLSGRQGLRVGGEVVAAAEPPPPQRQVEPPPLQPRVETPAPVEVGPKRRAKKKPEQATDRTDTETEPEAADTWRSLAARASYREALAAAEAQGFDRLCESLPADELLRLADVARFARSPKRATTALAALRRRFDGTNAAAMAAFERGRIAMNGGASGDAAKWFATYLRERPDGPLAREALGRLLEAQTKGKQSSAATTARRYLDRYPDGPHADLARRLAE